MSCAGCGYRFVFLEPFEPCNAVNCQGCGRILKVAADVRKEFSNNIEFLAYIESRKTRQAPPPATT